MAFQIFKRASGDPSKKPKAATPITDTSPLVVPRMEVQENEYGHNSRSTGISVEEEGQELPSSLQTAALLFASKQIKPAAATIKDALGTEDGKNVHVWQAYLDLLRRASDRATFDETALKYVVQFERSAPSWDELSTDEVGAGAVAALAAFITLPNSLIGEKPAAITSLLTQAKRPKTPDARLMLDARDLQDVDVGAAIAFTQALTTVRRQGWSIEWKGLKEAVDRMWKPLRAGEAKLKERWALGLELLIWTGREKDFEDRAVDYAVTFELSPPSWEKPSNDQLKAATGTAGPAKPNALGLVPIETKTEIGAMAQKLVWKGDMAGPTDPQLARLLTPTQDTQGVEIDMNALRYVDFVCAGAICNGIVRTMASGRNVRIFGASPILRALLQLTGVPENLFSQRKRKA
jgi:anti-anti-sigma regulatory factor